MGWYCRRTVFTASVPLLMATMHLDHRQNPHQYLSTMYYAQSTQVHTDNFKASSFCNLTCISTINEAWHRHHLLKLRFTYWLFFIHGALHSHQFFVKLLIDLAYSNRSRHRLRRLMKMNICRWPSSHNKKS